MNDKITFYYNPMSRGQVTHWMLEEVGADYEMKILDWKKAEHKAPEYLKINPMGKIPSIVHRGTVVTEIAAIAMYLGDAFPEKNLAPKMGDPERGSYYRWFFFFVNCVEAAVADRNSPRKEEITPMAQGYGTYADTMRTFEDAIKNGYILGKFSALDLYMTSVLNWYLFMKLIEPTPVILNYVKLCTDRPSYKKFSAKLEELMPKA